MNYYTINCDLDRHFSEPAPPIGVNYLRRENAVSALRHWAGLAVDKMWANTYMPRYMAHAADRCSVSSPNQYRVRDGSLQVKDTETGGLTISCTWECRRVDHTERVEKVLVDGNEYSRSVTEATIITEWVPIEMRDHDSWTGQVSYHDARVEIHFWIDENEIELADEDD